MPFLLKLKKTRQYNVASKSLFVISVELLDGGVADCTLSVDSTGQECLDNVCQRQAINQSEFFGLRYINRNQQPRWVQLELPLKRQLDKYASSHQLYLRIMYYIISGTSLITDEVTRSHYFLQLKNDLIEGRIVCDCQEAVILASYSHQAEYGNHDRERHTVEYLKNLLTFPKQMIDGNQIIESITLAETGRLEWLTAAVIQNHMALQNMSQAQAEEGYINACQLLRGYGQEIFFARDQLKHNDVTIAISLTGIMVVYETSDAPHFYRWMDIMNVINRKRTFSIECQNPADNATFILPTPEDGNYVWRMCVRQHTFYMKHQNSLTRSNGHNQEGDHPQPKFQEHGLSESRDDLDCSSNMDQRGSIPGLGAPRQMEPLQVPLSPSHRAHSTSCLELAAEPLAQHTHPAEIHRLRTLLPSYRPAPDYETAIQQKYQEQRVQAQAARYTGHTHNRIVNAKPMIYGSHPDIHKPVHYPDVTRHTVSINQGLSNADEYPYGLKIIGHSNYTPFAINPNVQTDLNQQLQYINVYKPPPPYPSNGLASNSTPDLAVASQALNYHRGYINSHVSGSSPDLVSTRSAFGRQYIGYLHGTAHSMLRYARPVLAAAHGTYNDLATVLDVANPHIIIDPRHVSDSIQKVYDERGNVMYSMPMHRLPYQRHFLPQTQKNDAQEPIYENVPLPWQGPDKSIIRDRAQSLTTTNEINKLNERNSSHPSISTVSKYSERQVSVPLPGVKVPNNYSSVVPPIKVTCYDSHYVNAQVIKGVRDSSLPKEFSASVNKIEQGLENVSLNLSKNDYSDETPYQSLSAHKMNISNSMAYNKVTASENNVTSISINSVPDVKSVMINENNSNVDSSTNMTQLSGSLDSSVNTTKSSVSSKEKKRRRWGMFIGRTTKSADVKSATLGRDRSKNSGNTSQIAKHRWSTGLPKFQPLPPSITKETLCHLLERKMSDNQLSFAFEQIPKGRETGGDITTALLPENCHINGYNTEHLPYEDNRVKLNPTPLNRYGYINASHITMTVGSSQRFYVIARVAMSKRSPKLTSSPPALDSTALLWECVWLVGARLIAIVGGEERPPHLPEHQRTTDYGKFQVHTETSQQAEWGMTCRVRIRCDERPARVVWHVQFTKWPENVLVPESPEHFLSYLSELSGLRLACAPDNRSPHGNNAPLVVCCSAGAGRSGTVLTADLLLHTLDHNQELDIPRTVSLLHQQRANLIQNVHQYRFLHQILLNYLKQSRLI